MRSILCALVVWLAAMPAPLVAADAAPTNEQLQKRLRDLDRRIERLERRERSETRAERQAEAKAAGAETAAAKLPTKADWQKVKFGAPEEQVRAILGPPLRTRKTSEHTIWSWHPDPTATGHEVWMRDGVADRVFPPS